ncbi:MAG: exodeoxyribonuclease VII small subunit [Clostridia bacterium]|nr:exodeoxyribonuclease VII small subunit [Clostridia bacterium]
MTKKSNENLSFEESLKKLEEIVSALESGNVPLDESIKLYESGIVLSNKCITILEEAKQKIEIIKSENFEANSIDADEIVEI